jgi:hypothetical protein
VPNKIEGPARLVDIEVDEVSLVDKAANKRKYLIVKNDDQNSQEGVENMADDKVNRVKKQSAAPEPEAPEAEGTPITDAEAGAAPEAGVKPVAKDTGAAAAPADGVETSEAAPDVQTLLTKAVTDLTGIVGDLAGQVKGLAAGEVAKDEVAAAVAPVVAPEPEAAPAPAEAAPEPEAAVEEVDTEKAGAKISKANLGKLTTAFTSIKSLLMELGVDMDGGNGAGTVKKEAGEPEAKSDAMAELSKITDGLGEVTKALGEVTERVKAVEGMEAVSKQAGDGGAEEPVKKSGSFWDGAV